MKPVLNIIIQLLWVALCLFAGYEVSVNFFSTSSFLVRGLVTGTSAIIIYAVIAIISNIISVTKDPDVKAASDLRMDVRRYRQYREWYDEHQRLMEKYGINSKEEQTYFMNFIKKIGNKNEWRRYQNFRFEQSRTEWKNMK